MYKNTFCFGRFFFFFRVPRNKKRRSFTSKIILFSVFGMGRPWLVACLLVSIATAVRAISTGAPAAACARIYPEGHNGMSGDLQTSPFVLDISPLYNQLGKIYYTPGYTYTRKLTC